MEYRLVILPSAERDLERLSPEVRAAILRKLDWLRRNADAIVHHHLSNLPDALEGLCRLRHGDYRILYWRYPADRLIKIYRVQHRSEVYREF
jgi:mRNA-degrading endonuclease RelE of RelBE toxin-antitoxin system